MEGNLENNTDWNCYIVNINSVQENNNGNYLEMYLKFCNHQEIEKIMSFVFPKDQIRALISIFLQRYIIMKKYQIISPSIQRTREVKTISMGLTQVY